ncbi:phosphoglucosamine mutase [Candidatus Bathyarchaeota archaeon]|nr:phosphoglucosamine mutase [Candidatus Bathyarchaeota archaeon]
MGVLFGTNGIRGLANVDLTPEFAAKVGVAVGTFLDSGEVVVGSDARCTSPMLLSAVTSGLTSAGCKVYNAGVAPTPTIQYTVKEKRVDGGIIITASHNPPEYNGIKVLAGDGVEISREDERAVEKIFFDENFSRARWDRVKDPSPLEGVIEDYLAGVMKHIKVEAVREKGFKVVVDPANGVGSLTLPKFLDRLGCKVYVINAELDGRFPSRPPEPRPENLGELARTVKALEADLGVALDGDADRAIFVDETGEIHWGDKTFALIAKFFLMENPNSTIVTPVSSSSIIKEVAEEYGGSIVFTKVGSVEVSHKMKELNAVLGGEENGGVFYAPHIPVRDGTMTTALILQIMAESEKKLSELLSDLPVYFIKKANVKCPNELKEKVMEKVTREFEALPKETVDGVKAFFPNGSAVLIRPSGTEPTIRIYAEAKSEDEVNNLIYRYTVFLEKVIKEVGVL